MISSEQIRAGRALLDWSQKQLSAKSGISLNALNNIERGVANPRTETLKAVQTALELEGVEFLDGKGVRLRGEVLSIESFEGPEIVSLYYDEFLKAFPSGPAEILFNGIDNERFDDLYEARLQAYRSFEKEAQRRGITERILVRDGETKLMSKTNAFRWAPKELFGEIPYAIFGDNIAIILWGPPKRLVVIRNRDIAETFRRQFELIWTNSKPVPDEVWDLHREKKG